MSRPAGLVDPDQDTLFAQHVYGFENGDVRSRPFKILRSQVYKRCRDSGAKLIGVTSPAPQAGKSFVAANLAAALSRLSDLKVWLVDLDLFRPAQATRFSVPEGPGIHDYLAGRTTDLMEVARHVHDERLTLLPGFKRRLATGELLTGPQGDALFAALRALPPSTVVLIDMPPIFADDDALILGQRIDGYLLVVEDGKTTARQVRETANVLQPTPLFGTVLNRYRDQLFSEDYGYGMSYGYGAYY